MDLQFRTPLGRVLGAWVLALALLTLAAGALTAQQGAVAGRVTDAGTGLPLSGVLIQVVGTALGAVTSPAGEYRVANISPGEVELRANMLGYSPATRFVSVAAAVTAIQDIALLLTPVSLDALVITATGLQRRRELGNATTTLQVGRELERTAPRTLTALLQGRAAGVQVLQNSGTTGAASMLKIRGNSSLGLDNTPLVYVDGARISNETLSGPPIGGQTTSRLNDLTLDDIESVEIVRGPSAATLYGTEAAAGVIRITTKRGRSGAAEWTFRSQLSGVWDATDWPDVVFNPRGLLGFLGPAVPDTVYRMNLLNDGTAGEGVYGTPWRTGLEQSYGASLRGGVEGVTYYFSGELARQEGTLINNEAARRNVRGNLNVHPSENVDIAVSTSFSSNRVALPLNDNTTDGFIAAALVGFPWEMPITRDDPVTGAPGVSTCPLHYEVSRATGVPIAFLGPALGLPPCAENPFFSGHAWEDVASIENDQKIERFIGSVTVDYRPASFLRASGTIGYDQFSDQTGTFYPVDPSLVFGDLSLGARSINNLVNRNFSLEGYVAGTFDLTPELRSTTTVGAQFFRTRTEVAGSLGRIFPAGPTTVANALRTEGTEGVAENRILGLYIQEQIAWRDRLFVTPAVRVDESSAFGMNLGRKVYPRIMASYVISEEDWFPRDLVESFRFRGAWGQSAKQPGTLASLQLLALQRTTFRGEDVAGVVFVDQGNPDLEPETGTEVELGWEASVLGGRLGVDFTFYHQITKDAIVQRDVPPSSGFPAPVSTNIGEIRNRGVEIGAYASALDVPGARWDWQLTLGTNDGEITRLDEPIHFGVDSRSQRHTEGYPFGAYFSRSYSIGGDGEVHSTDEPVFLGHPTPEYDGSLSTSLTLFDWVTLFAELGFAGGHQQLNSTEEFRCGLLGGGTYGGTCDAIFEEDTEGERTDAARIKAQAASDVEFGPWIEDASFARLRTVSARIEIPGAWLAHIGATRGSFTLAGENLALFTDYSGMDPEVNGAGGRQDLRVDFLTLPPARRVSGWVSITF